MKEPEHLTDTQLAGYFVGAFAATETEEIGRHLLSCDACRNELPNPSENVFFTALMNERGMENAASPRLPKFSASVPFRPSFYALSFSIVLLFFCAGLIYFIFFGSAKGDLNAEVNLEGESVETALLEKRAESPKINNGEHATPISEKTNLSAPLQKKSLPLNRKLILPETRYQKNVAANGKRNSRRETENIASVRGNTNSVRENGVAGAVDAKISVSGDSLKLSWLKYPQAASYSVVVTNAATNDLVDEIRLESGTEIEIPLKKFETAKQYEIRIAAVLPDGTIKTSKTFIYTRNTKNYRRKD